MKIGKFIYGSLLFAMLGMIGCSDWLDVQPKTSMPEEDLFAEEFGFQDALTGFYLKMGAPELYGREMTYNYMDMLAGRYEYAPNITVLIKLLKINFSLVSTILLRI